MVKDKDIITYDLVSEILEDEVDLQALHEDITDFVQSVKSKM